MMSPRLVTMTAEDSACMLYLERCKRENFLIATLFQPICVNDRWRRRILTTAFHRLIERTRHPSSILPMSGALPASSYVTSAYAYVTGEDLSLSSDWLSLFISAQRVVLVADSTLSKVKTTRISQTYPPHS